MWIKGNKEADKATKEAINMPRVTTTRIPYTDYYLPSGGQEIPSDKGNGKIVAANYATSHQASKNWRVPKTVVGNKKLNWVWSIDMDI